MIRAILSMATPLLLAGTGGLISERAGVLNIGLEGFILAGAFFAAIASVATGSVLVGFLAGAVAGCLLALVFALFAIKLEANLFIVGLSINLLAVGLTEFLSELIFGTRGVIRIGTGSGAGSLQLTAIESIPIVGEIVSGHTLFVPFAWFSVIAVGLFLSHTRPGLVVRATGIDREAARLRGLRSDRVRLYASLFAGLCGGFAGAVLALELGAFVPAMSAGRGWIALVMIFLGRRRATGVAAAAILFAAATYGANALQGVTRFPTALSLAFPYLATVASMIPYGLVARISSSRRIEADGP